MEKAIKEEQVFTTEQFVMLGFGVLVILAAAGAAYLARRGLRSDQAGKGGTSHHLSIK